MKFYEALKLITEGKSVTHPSLGGYLFNMPLGNTDHLCVKYWHISKYFRFPRIEDWLFTDEWREHESPDLPSYWISRSIDRLNLSARASNILTDNNLLRVSLLMSRSERELKSFPGMGPVTLKEIKDKLDEIGLFLKGT